MKKVLFEVGIVGLAIGVGVLLYFFVPNVFANKYAVSKISPSEVQDTNETEVTQPVITHIETPTAVKAVYMTSWVASTPSLREKIIELIDTTEVNSVIIDVVDYTGRISFLVQDPKLAEIGAAENRIRDIDAFIDELHEKEIYVIARIAVFQNPYLAKIWPEDAVKKASDGSVWADRKGITWLDAGSKRVWEHTVMVGNEAYARGFDELNFDYIRFPSDGNMKDIFYPHSEDKVKSEVLKSFFTYLDSSFEEKKIPISADLFGMTTTNKDDLGIGQILEDALLSFDYVCPMVYPSHYPTGWNNYKNPAANPGEIITLAMQGAVDRAKALGVSEHKLRPWLQDFNLGATYTEAMVRAQIDATYSVGLTSWLMWDPSNTYTSGALLAI